jgi:predicted neutral ceramidase superfamily lipid hydrolase
MGISYTTDLHVIYSPSVLLKLQVLMLIANKATYVSVAASGLNHQKSQNLENTNIHLTLQHILTKITNLEGAFSNMNERVKNLESDTKKSG